MHGCFPLFPTVLHNPPPLSTGCAQRGNGFELRRRRVRVQSLVTDNYENSSRSLPPVRGLGMEAGSRRAGARRHTLRLPVAGAQRRHDRVGAHSEEISELRALELYDRFPEADRSIALARISVSRFVQDPTCAPLCLP